MTEGRGALVDGELPEKVGGPCLGLWMLAVHR